MNRPFKLCQSFPQRLTENTPLLFSHFAHHYTYFQVLRNLHRTASCSAFSSHSHSSPLDRPVPHLPVVLPPGSTWLCYGVWSASPDPRECDATPALSRDFLEVSFKRWREKLHTDWCTQGGNRVIAADQVRARVAVDCSRLVTLKSSLHSAGWTEMSP